MPCFFNKYNPDSICAAHLIYKISQSSLGSLINIFISIDENEIDLFDKYLKEYESKDESVYIFGLYINENKIKDIVKRYKYVAIYTKHDKCYSIYYRKYVRDYFTYNISDKDNNCISKIIYNCYFGSIYADYKIPNYINELDNNSESFIDGFNFLDIKYNSDILDKLDKDDSESDEIIYNIKNSKKNGINLV